MIAENFETVAARLNGYVVAFTNQSSVTVTHNLGYHPQVEIYVASKMVCGQVELLSENAFRVKFTALFSGEIRYK